MLRLFGGEKLGCPRTLFIILLIIGFLRICIKVFVFPQRVSPVIRDLISIQKASSKKSFNFLLEELFWLVS